MKRLLIMFFCVAIVFGSLSTVYGSIFDNPRYIYSKIYDVPAGTVLSESQFSPDGTKILWNERYLNGSVSTVKYADWDPITLTLSNIKVLASEGLNRSWAKWSPTGSYIAYGVYSNDGLVNEIRRHAIADGADMKNDTALYTPGTGVDWSNFDFYGNDSDLVFWDAGVGGGADLFVYVNGVRSALTSTGALKEYEPRVFGTDKYHVLYWSGETTGEPYDSIHILNGDGSITNVALGTAGHNLYWPVWGKNQSFVGVVDWMGTGSTDLLLYQNINGVWQYVDDLTGPGYEEGNWNFFGGFDANGNFLFQSDYGGAGRDLWYAAAIPEPATLIVWSLLGLAAVGYGAWRRRRAV
jgi:hypothetical protein